MNSLYKKLIALGVSSTIALSGAYLVAPSEGLVLGTYRDPVGIITACYGTTGPELKMGQRFTQEECLKQLGDDLVKHDKELAKLVKVPYKSDYQHASLLSFSYNVGTNNVKNSTLLRKLNTYDYDGACYELTKWVFSTKDGVKIKLKGLVIRRTNEFKWCMGDVPQEVKEIAERK